MPIRVAIIEDNAPFAKTLAEYLGLGESSVECIGIYGSGEIALTAIPAARPEVVLVDINLPGMSGIECVGRLKAACPDALCLILTMYEDGALIFDALKAGACGYLLKRTPSAEIVSAIEQVRAGGSPMSPQIARQVVSFFHRPAGGAALAALTDRERDVLEWLAKGALYKEIARRLNISIDTVRTHLRRIYEKLHVHSRTEAVMKYVEDRSG